MNTPQGQQRTAEQRWVRWLQCLIRKWSCVNLQFHSYTQIAFKHTYMTRDLCHSLLFNYRHWHKIQSHQFANPFFGTLGHPHSLSTSASDYKSAQWRLVLHILVTCFPHVNKCWVTRAIYGIHWGRSHWPITIQHVRARWRSVVPWRTCSTGSEKAARVSRSIGDVLNGIYKYLQILIPDWNTWLVDV